jgi:DNA-binding NarL/FixJ family response regulator
VSPRSASSAHDPIRVALVDGSRRQREGWALLLGSQSDLVVAGQASDGARALTLLRRTPVDVVLAAIRLPRGSGLDLAARIRDDARVAELGRRPRVILLATLDLDQHVPAAAAAEAYAVVYKDIEAEALLGAIREAAAFDGEH